jgi:hypothetical protein
MAIRFEGGTQTSLDRTGAIERQDRSKLPSALINSIVLTTSGGDLVSENNPHVDDIRDANIVYLPNGDYYFKSQGIKYLTKTTTEDYLLIKVNLIIKEYTNQNAIGTWTDNEDLLKYFRIKVIQSNHKDITQKIVDSATVGEKYIWEDLPPKAEGKLYQTETISVQDTIRELKHYDYTVLENETRVYNVTFEAAFTLRDVNPKHLSCFASTYLDLEQLQADMGCTSGNIGTLNVQPTGEPAIEKAILNGEVVENTIVYSYGTPKKYYTGRVIREDGKYFTSTVPPISLTRETVPNNTVKDERDINSFLKDIWFSLTEDTLTSMDTDRIASEKYMHLPAKEYINNLAPSRDKNGNYKTIFAINYGKLLSNGTEFGKLFETKDSLLFQALSRTCRIRSIRCLRRRIKPNSISSRDLQPFNEQIEFTKAIAYSSEIKGTGTVATSSHVIDSFGRTVTHDRNKNPRTDELVGIIKEVDLHPASNFKSNGIRHISLVDTDISRVTDGIYQYGVEIEVEDGTRDYLRTLNQQLLTARKNLEQHYTICMSRVNGKSNYNSFSRSFTKRFIALKQTQYPSTGPGAKIEGKTEVSIMSSADDRMHSDKFEKPKTADLRSDKGFMTHAHRYSINQNGNGQTEAHEVGGHVHRVQNFRVLPAGDNQHTHSIPVLNVAKNSPWSSSIKKYLSVLKVISMNQYSIGQMEKITKILYDAVAPETGSPEGILSVIGLIDSLYAKIQTTVGDISDHSSKSALVSSKSALRTFKIEKWFDDIVDANLEKGTGYNYFDTEEKADPEVMQIRGSEYGELHSDLGFASPSFAELGGTKIRLDFEKLDSLDLAILETAISIAVPQSRAYSGVKTIESSAFMTSTKDSSMFNSSFGTGGSATRSMVAEMISAIGTTIDITTKVAAVNKGLSMLTSELGVTTGEEDISSLGPKSSVLSMPGQATIDQGVWAKNYLGENSKFVTSTSSDPFNSDNEYGAQGCTTESVATAPIIAKEEMTTISGQGAITGLFQTETLSAKGALTLDRFDLTQKTNLIKTGEVTDKDMRNLPDTIKKAFSEKTSKTRDKFRLQADRTRHIPQDVEAISSQGQQSYFRMNYNLIKQVEVLVGYEDTNKSAASVRSPIWLPINSKLINGAMGKNLLCRLVEYSNAKLGIDPRSAAEMPVYDEHFLMIPDTKASSRTGRQRTTQQRTKQKKAAKRTRKNASVDKMVERRSARSEYSSEYGQTTRVHKTQEASNKKRKRARVSKEKHTKRSIPPSQIGGGSDFEHWINSLNHSQSEKKNTTESQESDKKEQKKQTEQSTKRTRRRRRNRNNRNTGGY